MSFKFLWLAFFCCLPEFIFSQNYSISGRSVEENKAIAYASLVLKKDSVTISEIISDSIGNYKFSDLTSGHYTLYGSYLGINIQKEINLTQNLIQNINFPSGTNQIEEVRMTGKKALIERKVDRLIFNVENSTAAAGGDVMDVLRVAPRVKVQNDQISMVGKSGLSVMVDERIIQLTGDDLINYLKTIKSENIKSIEIITLPPSKYNAEGNSGIVNIKTKKAKSNSWNGNISTTYKQATYATGSGSASYNIKKDKITLSSSASYIYGSLGPTESNKIYYPDLIWQETNNRRDRTNSASFNVGLDYEISKKWSMGLVFNHANNKPVVFDNNISQLTDTAGNNIDSLFITKGRNERKRISNQLNYHVVYLIDSVGRKLSLDYDFFNYVNDSYRPFNTIKTFSGNSVPLTSAINKGEQNIRNNSINIDMEHPLEWIKLNYGARASFITTENDFKYFKVNDNTTELDTNQSNLFNYTENTQSLYFSGYKKIADEWEIKLGMRMENTQTEGISATLQERNKMKFTKFFPTLYVVYTPNKDNSLSINYGRRIQRPSYNFLNPFRWITSPYMYSEGNPFLQPSFTDNIELGYSYKNNYNTNLYFTYIDKGFGQVTFLDSSTNIQRIYPINYLVNKTIGLNQTFSINPVSWLSANLIVDIYYSYAKSEIEALLPSLKGWNGEFTFNTDIIFNKNKTFFANINFLYVTAGTLGLDKNTAYNQLDISLKMLLLNKKLVLSLHLNDMLSSNRPTYTTYTNSIKNSITNYYDDRFVRFSMSYNFGKSFSNKMRKEKNTEEFNRVR
ncbi:hypothetical protein BN1195_01306 [Chryseobacterium oranimense G311]|uniref:TonB-dependent receptor domain-containing protein n=1 Tax=Chryseobacterium oranimense TaxID=421058 RepID=UPI0005336E5F|nr:TonB-dependent receptor [Chryseobacterium oranimense]CEJ69014.1 hypothetical protein BN1195_01306 [Chryseobacterium oranimense G311]